MAKNVLVTGASGNLGNYVSPYLKKKGYNVTNFDIKLPVPGSANDMARIPFVKGDLVSLGDCMRAIAHAQPDVIVHLGAIPYNTEIQPAYAKDYNLYTQNGVRFIQHLDEDETMKTNTMGTFYLMDAARRLGVKRVVAISSYFVLGIGFRISGTPFIPHYLPIDENHPCSPEDTYSLSKLLGEEICKAFTRAYGMNVIVLRLLGVYYPDSDMSKNMYKFNINVPPATDEGNGYISGNTYQYVDARDVARIIELSIEAKGLNPYEEFFVSTDTVYAENTTEVIAKRWPAFKDMGKDIKGTDGIISIEKAKKLLGYKPAFSWRTSCKSEESMTMD